MSNAEVTPDSVDRLHSQLDKEAKAAGYNLNNDMDFVQELVKGLLINEIRYGYRACPCRLASGNKEDDLDIICPCYYRDADLNDFDACYCALYVSAEVVNGKKKVGPVPERRPPPDKRAKGTPRPITTSRLKLTQPVWRCIVCGYLCGRSEPPQVCPICKASKERFERFI